MYHDQSARPCLTHKTPFAARMQAAIEDALQDGGVKGTPSFSRYATIYGADVALVLENRTGGELRALAHGFGVIHMDADKERESARLIRIAMRAFGVSRTDILSARRTRRIVLARHFVCHWLYRRTSMSTTMVGRAIGGIDHTTVINACRRWQERRGEARAVRAMIRDGLPINRAEAAMRISRTRGLIAYAGAEPDRRVAA